MREHDACGIGMVCNIDGRKTHSVVNSALQIVEKLDHRAGKDASGKVGDGVGILLQISHTFFSHILNFLFLVHVIMVLECFSFQTTI